MKKGAKAAASAAVAGTLVAEVAQEGENKPGKKPAAKRGPRKNPTATTSDKPAAAPPKEKKPATKVPVNTLMNYIKPVLGQESGLKTLSVKAISSVNKSKPTAAKSTNLVEEPPNQRELLKMLNSKEINRERIAEIDVNKLIKSWESDVDDFELFDLNMSLNESSTKAGNKSKSSFKDETKSMIEKYERIYLDMRHELSVAEIEKEKAAAARATQKINDELMVSKTSQHFNSVINDTVEMCTSINMGAKATGTTMAASTEPCQSDHKPKPQKIMVYILKFPFLINIRV